MSSLLKFFCFNSKFRGIFFMRIYLKIWTLYLIKSSEVNLSLRDLFMLLMLNSNSEHAAHASRKKSLWGDCSICECSRSHQMPLTDQIARIVSSNFKATSFLQLHRNTRKKIILEQSLYTLSVSVWIANCAVCNGNSWNFTICVQGSRTNWPNKKQASTIEEYVVWGRIFRVLGRRLYSNYV